MATISPNYTFITQADAKPGDLISMWARKKWQQFLAVRRLDEKAGNPLLLISFADGFKCFHIPEWPKHVLRVEDEWRFRLTDESAIPHDHGFSPGPGRLCLAANRQFLVIETAAFQNQLFDTALANLKSFELDDRPEGPCVSFDWVIEIKDAGTTSWKTFNELIPNVEVVR